MTHARDRVSSHFECKAEEAIQNSPDMLLTYRVVTT